MSNISVYTGNKGTNAHDAARRLFSTSIWGDCPWESIQRGYKDGVYFFDDFDRMPLIGTQTTQIAYDKYKIFSNTSCSITPKSAVNSVDLGGGILDFANAANNDTSALAQSYPAFKISGAPATSNKLWFECSVAASVISTLATGFFVGLAETNLFTLALAVPYNADAALLNNSGAMIGFNRWEIISATAAATTNLPGGLNTVYNDRATTFTVTQADAYQAFAANTFVKLGFIYDPNSVTKAIRYFANGIELTTATTLATITGTTNLKANSLGLLMANVSAATTPTAHNYIDWWACAQLGITESL